MKSILYITFDFFKEGYQKIPYSIATLLAYLKQLGISADHKSIDLTPFADLETLVIDKKVEEEVKKNLIPLLNQYSYIAPAPARLYLKSACQI